MLQETTDQVVKAIPEFQEMLRCLETIQSEIEEYSTSRVVDGKIVKPEELQDQVDELIDDYHEEMESLWQTGMRAKNHPEIHFDPIEGRYNRWRKKRTRQQAESGQDAVRHFFADD